jgi:hypothetical protein
MSVSDFARPEDLLERALVELREVLRSDVETACDLMGPYPDRTPAPGTCDLPWEEPINRTLALVRDIEAEIGRPTDLEWTSELTGPTWLTDLVEGKWGLT